MKLDLSSENKDGIRIEHSFEDLHDPQFDKYFVSLFADDPKTGRIYRGNGVIVGPYLITAAHVAQSEDKTISFQKMYFRLDDELKEVCNEDIVHDGRGYDKESQIHDDLIIYKLQGIESELRLNDEPINLSLDLDAILYERSNCRSKEGKAHTCVISCLNAGFHGVKYSLGKEERIDSVWENCYKVLSSDWLKDGNSGGAFFNKNIVYGILIEVPSDGQAPSGTVLDARYIKRIINSKSVF